MTAARPLVLITGGSRGIGAATARLAARRGYDVALTYRHSRPDAEAVAADCRTVGAAVEILQGDIANAPEVERIFADCEARMGRPTHFVNNAGTTGRLSRLDEASVETIRACIDLNVTGALLAARAAVRLMSPRHGGLGGAIVNVSSMASTLGSAGEYVWYAASKGAMDALTIGLSRELAAEGIRVNGVAPGLIATDIHVQSSQAPGRLERLGPQTPMGRAGTAEEVAEAILYLLSDAASYVTGSMLRVSGGR